MKRPVVTAVFLFAVAGLAGCPVYDHDSDGCYRDSDCARNYVCNQNNGDCVLANDLSCSRPSDCDSTSTCTSAGLCAYGDCTFNGCVAGYRCDSSTKVWLCVANGSGAAGASGQAGAGDVTGQGAASGQAGADPVSAAGAPAISAGGANSGG
jgi:hypothetical protein